MLVLSFLVFYLIYFINCISLLYFIIVFHFFKDLISSCISFGVFGKLQVYFTPNLYHAIMTVVESAKILSVPTRGHGDTKDDKTGDLLYPHRAQHLSHTLEHTKNEDDKVKDVEAADKQSGMIWNDLTC